MGAEPGTRGGTRPKTQAFGSRVGVGVVPVPVAKGELSCRQDRELLFLSQGLQTQVGAAAEHFIYKWAAHVFWGQSRYHTLSQSRLHQERDPGRDFGSCHPGGSRLGCLFAAPSGQ